MSPLSWLLALAASLAAGGANDAPDSPTSVDATLTVRLVADKSTYAVGELIPVELEFRGHAGPDYHFTTASYDRSGRPGLERYVVTPRGGSDDPLADHFASFGSVGGGLSGWAALDGTPFVVRGCLNEWVRFTRPGRYQLVVESRRLRRYSGGAAPVVVSSPVALRIEPAPPEWAAEQTARAVDRLGGNGEERQQAVTVLRHLGTRDAALALVQHYGEGGDALRFDWFAGIVASPFRQDVVSAMEARLDAAEPLPGDFIGDLARVRSLLQFPAGASHGKERFEAEQAAACRYARRFIARLRERPSAAGIGAALGSAGDGGEGCDTGLAELLAAHPAEARAGFASQPPATQVTLLQFRWDAIAGPWTLPLLVDLYQRGTGDWTVPGPGDHALRRLHALDPSRGRSLAIDEIRSGAHGITADTLLALVREPLTGLDDALRARYDGARCDGDRDVTMWLVARHGSAGLVPFVKAALRRDAPCEREAAALAYLLAHDPGDALERLQPAFDRSGPGVCVIPPWTSLAARLWDERLEQAALAHLERGSARQVAEAVRLLGRHGSAAVKQPLLGRLARWNEQWRGRDADLAALTVGPPAVDSPIAVESALVDALLNSRSFALTGEEIARVRSLCLTAPCRTSVDGRARGRPAR